MNTKDLARTKPSRPRPGAGTQSSRLRTRPKTEILFLKTTKVQGQGQHHWLFFDFSRFYHPLYWSGLCDRYAVCVCVHMRSSEATFIFGMIVHLYPIQVKFIGQDHRSSSRLGFGFGLGYVLRSVAVLASGE